MNITSRFVNLPEPQKNKIFDSLQRYESDTNPIKLNLSIGMLYNEEGKLEEFESVEAAQKIIQEAKLNKEYPPITGMPEFLSAIQNLFFDSNSEVVKEGRIIAVQTITGGAALRVCAEVISRFLPKKIHLSNLTFEPYKNIFTNLEICYYPYYNKELKKLDVDAFVEYLIKIEEGSIINLQLSSHNPTALDLAKEDWNRLAEVMKEKQHFALFDVAYLGYGSGSIQEDIYPIRKFAENKIEMFICYSSAKNFANFSDDVGALMVVLNKKEPAIKLKSHLVVFNRSLFSFSSLYGTRIIEKILNTPELKEIWLKDQKRVIDRIAYLRLNLIDEIKNQEVNIDINFLRSQRGIYLFLDLADDQIVTLAEKYSIYVCEGGRINICSLKKDSISYLVGSLKDVLSSKKEGEL